MKNSSVQTRKKNPFPKYFLFTPSLHPLNKDKGEDVIDNVFHYTHFHINIVFAVITDTSGSDIQVMLCTTGRDNKKINWNK